MGVTLKVEPLLSKDDRKALSMFVQALKIHRPTQIESGFTFQYRGSSVTLMKR